MDVELEEILRFRKAVSMINDELKSRGIREIEHMLVNETIPHVFRVLEKYSLYYQKIKEQESSNGSKFCELLECYFECVKRKYSTMFISDKKTVDKFFELTLGKNKKAISSKQDIGMYEISNTDDIFKDAQNIVEQTRNYAYQAVNIAMIQRNWLLGKRIADEELQGENRAEYGKEVINRLANHLTNLYGKGFSKSNLYQFVQFYKYFPEIFHSASGKSFTLSWTHYRTLLRVTDKKAREWYLQESEDEMWSVRTLDRNIASQYYYRLLQSQNKQKVKDEMKDITAPLQQDNLEFIKNPVVAEFLGLSPNADFSETKLESSIISHIQKFVMELGKGYAFVARQQHIKTDVGDYFIDLVFYNYILKCFLLIDLKTSRITHQDVGQMDMYVRMYDNLKRTEGDNPTIGLILCSETSKDMARYSVLHDNERLFQARYLTFLPSIEQLKEEIELQKEIFQLQQSNDAPTKQ